MEIVLKVCEELEKETESRILPWINNLVEEDRALFYREFKDTALHAVDTGNWNELEYLIEDWKATAEVENHPELKDALMKDGNVFENNRVKRAWLSLEKEYPERTADCVEFLKNHLEDRTQAIGILKKLKGRYSGILQYDITKDNARVWYKVDKAGKLVIIKHAGHHPDKYR